SMMARLRALLGSLNRIFSVVAVLLLLLIVTASGAAYLAVSGKNLPLLRAVTARVDPLFAGQRTEQLTLTVRVDPSATRLTGTATLTVRSLEEGRRRFYFLLNDGLRLRAVRLGGPRVSTRTVPAYHLSLLTVVDIEHPLAKDSTVQLVFDYEGNPAM